MVKHRSATWESQVAVVGNWSDERAIFVVADVAAALPLQLQRDHSYGAHKMGD